jgi:DNA-binding NarL/FixJ family response regulator
LKLVNLVLRVRPDVLLVDYEISPLNGADVARTLRERVPKTPVVVISRYASDVHAVACLRNGASAYVTKAAPPQELLEAIDAVRQGKKYVGSPLSRRPLRYWLARAERGVADTYEMLSTREREVLHLVSQGLSSSGVSRRLGIGARTVETHRERLKDKLGVRNTAGLIRYAIERQMFGLARERRRQV